jgi:hypothetical protein
MCRCSVLFIKFSKQQKIYIDKKKKINLNLYEVIRTGEVITPAQFCSEIESWEIFWIQSSTPPLSPSPFCVRVCVCVCVNPLSFL